MSVYLVRAAALLLLLGALNVEARAQNVQLLVASAVQAQASSKPPVVKPKPGKLPKQMGHLNRPSTSYKGRYLALALAAGAAEICDVVSTYYARKRHPGGIELNPLLQGRNKTPHFGKAGVVKVSWYTFVLLSRKKWPGFSEKSMAAILITGLGATLWNSLISR